MTVEYMERTRERSVGGYKMYELYLETFNC